MEDMEQLASAGHPVAGSKTGERHTQIRRGNGGKERERKKSGEEEDESERKQQRDAGINRYRQGRRERGTYGGSKDRRDLNKNRWNLGRRMTVGFMEGLQKKEHMWMQKGRDGCQE